MDSLVSVIIPVYNVKQYLEECIDSVLVQTYKNLQIIIVDDGSTDGSSDICDLYKKDARVMVIHKANGGLSDARNTGLSVAEGEFIYFLDSDDKILPFAIEALVSKIKITNADCVFFDADVFGGDELPKDYYHRKNVYPDSLGTEMLKELIKRDEYRSPVQLMFFSKKFLDKCQIKFKKDLLHEDELFTFEVLAACGLVSHLPLNLYEKRLRFNSIIATKPKYRNFDGIITVIKELCEFLKVNNISLTNDYVKKNFNRLVLAGFDKYYKMDKADKDISNKNFKYLIEFCGQMQYFDSRRIKIYCRRSLYYSEKIIRKIIRVLHLNKILKRVIKILLTNKGSSFEYKKTDRKTIWLIGTPEHGNLGDHAIAIAAIDFIKYKFKGYDIKEISMPQYREYKKKINRIIKKDDIICICGGGWLGTLWLHNEIVAREIVNKYTGNNIVILPQTVYYDDTEDGKKELKKAQQIYQKHKHLYFCLRDKLSYDFVINNDLIHDSRKCFYVPDMAMLFNYDNLLVEKEHISLCFRHDKEKIINEDVKWYIEKEIMRLGYNPSYITTVYLENIGKEKRRQKVIQKLNEYSAAKLVITDRLHSMIFSAITGTPCIALDNKSHKISSVYEWIKDLEYIKLVNSAEEAIGYIPQLLGIKNCVYDRGRIKSIFDECFDLIGEDFNG